MKALPEGLIRDGDGRIDIGPDAPHFAEYQNWVGVAPDSEFQRVAPTPERQLKMTTSPAGRIMLRNVRLAFPNIFTPAIVGDDPATKPRYSAKLVLPPDHPQLAEIHAAMRAVAQAKWGPKAADIYRGIEKADKLALHDGDTNSQFDGFVGNYFITAAAKESVRPTVLDGNKSPLTERDGKPYSGCYVNVSLEMWAQDNGFGKRINAQLRGVQFLRDGDAFGSGQPAGRDEFDDVAGADADDIA